MKKPVNDKPTKVDPRVKRTRQMLQEAMNALMHEKHFQDISVQDITDRAGVNRATFYAHFLDKYDLVNAIIRDRFQSYLNKALTTDMAFTRTNLYRLIQAVYDYLVSFPGNCQSSHLHSEQQLMVQQVQLQLYTVILDWLQRSPFNTNPAVTSSEATAMLASWAIFGPILQTAWGKEPLPTQQLFEQIMTLVETACSGHLIQEQGS